MAWNFSISAFFSEKAFVLAAGAFPRVLSDPEDIQARGDMLRAAAFGGLAIENSMLGAAHSLANPLTARFDVPHGQAVAMMLPHVVRFNGGAVDHLYGELADAAQLNGSAPDATHRISRRVNELRHAAGLPGALGECGVERSQLGELAAAAAREWTAGFNPRPVEAPDLEALYAAAF